jgi:hypothetical protein
MLSWNWYNVFHIFNHVRTGLTRLNTGFVRYFAIQHALVDGKFPVPRLSITFLTFVVGAVVIAVFGVLVSAGPRP